MWRRRAPTPAGADDTAALLSGVVAANTVYVVESRVNEAETVPRESLGEDRYSSCVARGATMNDAEFVALAHREITCLLDRGSPPATRAVTYSNVSS